MRVPLKQAFPIITSRLASTNSGTASIRPGEQARRSWYTRPGENPMRQSCFVAAAIVTFALTASSQESGPYKVLKTARVGGEGGWDYIYADVAGRRLYIPRGATRAVEATATTPAVPATPARLTIFNLDTLEPAGEVAGVGGNGATVDPKTGHGFTSDH